MLLFLYRVCPFTVSMTALLMLGGMGIAFFTLKVRQPLGIYLLKPKPLARIIRSLGIPRAIGRPNLWRLDLGSIPITGANQ